MRFLVSSCLVGSDISPSNWIRTIPPPAFRRLIHTRCTRVYFIDVCVHGITKHLSRPNATPGSYPRLSKLIQVFVPPPASGEFSTSGDLRGQQATRKKFRKTT